MKSVKSLKEGEECVKSLTCVLGVLCIQYTIDDNRRFDDSTIGERPVYADCLLLTDC